MTVSVRRVVPKSNVQKFHHEPEWWRDKIKRQRVQRKEEDLALVHSWTYRPFGIHTGLSRILSKPNSIINMSIIKSIIYNRCRLRIYSLHRREHVHTIWSIIVWSKWSRADRAVSVSKPQARSSQTVFHHMPINNPHKSYDYYTVETTIPSVHDHAQRARLWTFTIFTNAHRCRSLSSPYTIRMRHFKT